MTARQLHERLLEAGQHGAAVAVAAIFQRAETAEAQLRSTQEQHAMTKDDLQVESERAAEANEEVNRLLAERDHLKARVALLEAQLAKAPMPTLEEVIAP